MPNIAFSYLYRDGSNYKNWGNLIFLNPHSLSLEEVEQRLRKAFVEQEFFIASQIQVPEVFSYLFIDATEDDHYYHEYNSVEKTEAQSNDSLERTISDFLKEVEKQSCLGWLVFQPVHQKSF